MHKLYALALLVVPATGSSQSLVSSHPQNRTALLEDFTGIHCGYCPDGHTIAAAIEDQHTDQVVVVGVHAGPYAVPSVGEPDFQTPEATAIDAFFTIGGYPAGVINRHTFAGENDLGRAEWAAAVDDMLALPSPVNLGVESSFDAVSRDLTVTVELLYTANSPAPGNDHISVLLKESHIIGWQTDYGPSGNHTNYDHTNVLRDYITDTWGDTVSTTSAGTSVTRTYVFNVPLAWDIANCEVVAFVSEYQAEVYQAREIPADGGTTLVVGDLVLTSTNDHAGGSNGTTTAFDLDLTNVLGASEDFLITLDTYDQPSSWSAGFDVNGTAYTGSTTVNIADLATADIAVNVTPDAAPGIGNYLLTVASVNNPMAPVLSQDFHVISGVTDLVVTNLGAEPHEVIYEDALIAAAQPNRARCTNAQFRSFSAAGALGDVFNIYNNVSWTFPAFTDETAAALQAHLDGGGNLMIAGQDIGWDQSGASGSNGTAVTQAFYEDYMHADYVADGSTANSQVNFVPGDAVFGAVPTSAINSVFGTSSYPEEITPIAPATSIMTYNTPTKIGALRVETGGYKLTYFGVGPEQMSNAAVAEAMIRLSHDWFYGIVGVEEMDAEFAALLNGTYPIPADRELFVPLTGVSGPLTLELLDATGRVMTAQRLAASTSLVRLDVSMLASGGYSLRLLGNDRIATLPVQVVH